MFDFGKNMGMKQKGKYTKPVAPPAAPVTQAYARKPKANWNEQDQPASIVNVLSGDPFQKSFQRKRD
jgi:hypothetical protein